MPGVVCSRHESSAGAARPSGAAGAAWGVWSRSLMSPPLGGRQACWSRPHPASVGPGRGARSPLGHTVGVPATILDGKVTAAAIRTELPERAAALTAAGHQPGLGTLLVGDDPGSRWYVGAKHKDCAEVGIASIERELPESATQPDVLRVVAELNAAPACTSYIVWLTLPRQVD